MIFWLKEQAPDEVCKLVDLFETQFSNYTMFRVILPVFNACVKKKNFFFLTKWFTLEKKRWNAAYGALYKVRNTLFLTRFYLISF